MPPMPRTDRTRADDVDCRGRRCTSTSRTSPMPDSTTAMTTASPRNADPPRQVGGDEPADQRPDRGGDRGRRADQGVHLPLGVALEVAVDQRLHRRQQQRGAEAADDRPEDHDRQQFWANAIDSAPTA